MKKCIAILVFCLSVGSFAQIVNIPDANFKAALIAQGVDTNSDGEIQESEALQVTSGLSLNGLNISDLTGIKSFSNLTGIECDNNSIVSLDLSDLTSLQHVSCNYNQIATLNVSNCTNLMLLFCENNQLTSIDTSGLTNLQNIMVSQNPPLVSLNTSGCVSLNNLTLYNMIETPNSPNLLTVDISNCPLLTEFYATGSQLNSVNLSGCVGLTYIDIMNTQITSLDVSNLTNLVNLLCGNNQLTSLNINGCTNLTDFNCYDNQLSGELNLSGFSQLTQLSAYGNNFTSIDVSNCVNLNDFSFDMDEYLVTLNASNCTSLVSLSANAISNAVLTSLDLTNCSSLLSVNYEMPQLQNISLSGCTGLTLFSNNSPNGSLFNSLDLSGLVSLQTLYAVNNDFLTSINLNGCLNLQSVNLYNNALTSVDFSGLPSITTINIRDNQLTELDVSTNPNLQQLSIGNNPLINLFAKNGANETINFLGNPNLEFVCVDESQVVTVQTELDNVGLTSTVCNSYCSFTPGGNYNTISGTIKFDNDNDGCDINDVTQSLVRVNVSSTSGNNAIFTNSSGQYQRYVLEGDYTVSPVVENPFWFFSTPTDSTVSFPNTNNNAEVVDFCIAPTPSHTDVEVVIAPITLARPGFDAIYLITYKNKGNTTVSGQVAFNFDDAVLDYISSTVAPTAQNQGILVYDYFNLQPFETRSFYITLNVNSPTEVPAVNINDELLFVAIITTDSADENSEDNIFEYNQTVVGSYDPNDIICIEGDVVPPSEIGEYLHYIINFENTGTTEAESIVVKVDIDESQFDIDSLQLLNTSHAVDARINGNKVEFIFQEIWLDTGGHGNVLLKIRTKNNLLEGDSVAKQANIYFDYNAPIETNMANTTFEILSNGNFEIDESIMIFPNPTASIININCNNAIKTVELYDVQGRLLQTQIVESATTSLVISMKTNGIYFVKITSENGVKVEKISKE